VATAERIRVAVAGASGYMGAELLRLLLGHPRVTLTGVTSERLAGEPLAQAYPHLRGLTDLRFHDLEAGWLADVADVVFLALPHMESQRAVPVLRARGRKVVDLSADYRLRDPQDYVTWYKAAHLDPAGLAEAVYGLPELHRKAIAGAALVASPGCYPMGAILAIAPLLKNGLAGLDGIVIDGKSGVTGAGAQGRKVDPMYLYTEANENLQAYAIASHRHTPEIEQELGGLGNDVTVTFIPHLVPLAQGELVSCYVRPTRDLDDGDLAELYDAAYARERWVELARGAPGVIEVRDTNYCRLSVHVDSRAGRVIVFSALDNLWKGAASQAVQNLNLMFGLDESAGLR
jgi:N-acetyl-gamma-glutamyl-phosphate reductase